jgi:hypothetical protein
MGEQNLMGENMKSVWAEFSTSSWLVLHNNKENVQHANGHFYS